MASAFKPKPRTYTAGGAINPNSFVKLSQSGAGSAKNPIVVQCGANDAVYGIAQMDGTAAAALGDSVEVALPGGGGLLQLGAASGTVSSGQSLKSDNSGYGVPTTTAGDRVGAQAVEGGVASDIIGVDVQRFEKYNGDAT